MICTNVLVEKILLNSVICVPSRDRISFVLDEQQDLATMAKSDSKLDRLLPQRPFGPFRELRNLGDGRPRFRMSAQLFHIRIGVFATHDNLLRLSLSLLLICRSALLAHTNTLASCIRLTCGPVENGAARPARTEKSPLPLSKAAKKPRKKIAKEKKVKRQPCLTQKFK